MKKNSLVSIAFLFLTAIIWGFAFAFQTMSNIGTFWFNGIRFFIGVISLLPVILIFERKMPDAAEWRKLLLWGAVAGFVLFSASSLQQYGIQMLNAANAENPEAASAVSARAGFITGLYMVFVPLCGLFFRQRVRAEAWLGAIVAVIGLYFVSIKPGQFAFELGDAVILIGAFFWTAHIVVIDRHAADISPLKFSLVQFITCGALSLICAVLFERNLGVDLALLTANALPILYCGIFSVGVAYTCQVVGQRGVEPALASIILCTESVFAAVGGVLLLHENMGARGWIGCALIFAGILLSQAKIFSKKA